MALPTITVRVAFATAPFAAAPTWTDISHDVMGFEISRGRMHELDRMEAGLAYIRLKNTSLNYWATNSGGLYYPNIVPRKRVNIRAAYGGTTYDLYTGFAEAWQPSFLSERGGQVSIVELNCADLIKNLARLDLNAAGYAEELSGARIGHLLDDLGWPAADRDLDAGQSLMQGTGALANDNALEHAQLVQLSEAGIMYIAGDGHVQFEDRQHRLNAPHTVSQATFSDVAGNQHYHGIEPVYEDTYIFNDVRLTCVGGAQQAAEDATSQTDYGKSTLPRTGLIVTTDAEMLAQAQYLLSRYKDPALRVRKILLLPERDPANLWPKALGYDISTRITVAYSPAEYSRESHIEGIKHVYDALTNTWQTEWQLSDADNQAYWALGTTGLSELGETTRLFY